VKSALEPAVVSSIFNHRSLKLAFGGAALCLGLSHCALSNIVRDDVKSESDALRHAEGEKTALSSVQVTVSKSSNEVIRGEVLWVKVALSADAGDFKVTAEWDGLNIPFWRDGNSFLGMLPVRFDSEPGIATARIHVASQKEENFFKVSFNKRFGKYRKETLRVLNPRTVKPLPDDEKRIAEEATRLQEIYRRTSLEYSPLGSFTLPVASAVTSPYGTSRIYNGLLQSVHLGLDLRAAIGTPVKAALAGKVVLASPLFFTGNTVVLDHGYGIYSVYAHLNELSVKETERVEIGTLIGKAGKTGRSTAPHLHWGIVVHGVRVNPASILKHPSFTLTSSPGGMVNNETI
jgi:murein DD-endopeptidase MepM/ murein hydrolase activator NlpD